jgi:hypothetical protein
MLLTLSLVSAISASAIAADSRRADNRRMVRPRNAIKLVTGITPRAYREHLMNEAIFVDQFEAKAIAVKNSRARVLYSPSLDLIEPEKVPVGLVGYSGGKKFNEKATRAEMAAFYRVVDPQYLMIASGATPLGTPKVAYELAHENPRRYFTTLGITPLAATKYGCSEMDYLLSLTAVGQKWGDDSRFLVKSCPLLLAVGGNTQSIDEMDKVLRLGGDVIAIYTPEIGGASGIQAKRQGLTYLNGSEAGKEVMSRIKSMPFFKWVDGLASQGTQLYSARGLREQALPEIPFGGFTGWSRNGPGRQKTAATNKWIQAFFRQFKAGEFVTATSGVHVGFEKLVHNAAHKRGFDMAALVANQIAANVQKGFKFFDSKGNNGMNAMSSVATVARTWNGRVSEFVNNADFLVAGGGGDVVLNQVEAARQRNIPVVVVPGNFDRTDQRVPTDHQFANPVAAANHVRQELSADR